MTPSPEYNPRPIDTGGIQLPPEVEALAERLAASAHDVWALQRLSDGWRYGPERNDMDKHHPDLVPYEDLPEGEKEYDRRVAAETLKAVIALGFRVELGPRGDESTAPESGKTVPTVEVGVALVRVEDRILVVYNGKWGGFTLPMTKRRRWQSRTETLYETWADAAARAVVECMGRTCQPEFLCEMEGVLQSDREGTFKRYDYQVFAVDFEDRSLVSGTVGEWLLPDAILDEKRRPLTPTLITIAGELHSRGKL